MDLDPATVQRRIHLIRRGLSENNDLTAIRERMDAGLRPKGFWGMSIMMPYIQGVAAYTEQPQLQLGVSSAHIAYMLPLLKIAEFVDAGLDITILLCDLYAFLVNYDDSWITVRNRTCFYEYLVKAVLSYLGLPDRSVHFVRASTHELTPEVMFETYRLMTKADEADVRATGEECVDATKLSALVCPLLPALAEIYLDADFQFGGEDQLGLFKFNNTFLPQLGHRPRGHLTNPMVPGLQGNKMSSSVPDSKIDFLDSDEDIREKIFAVQLPTGKDVVKDNGLLALLKHVVFPVRRYLKVRDMVTGGALKATFEASEAIVDAFHFVVKRASGEEVYSYSTYQAFEDEYVKGLFSEQWFKCIVSEAVIEMVTPIREMFAEDWLWRAVDRLSYPDE